MLTPHFNGKKLSTNSPWDFEYVLETMDDYSEVVFVKDFALRPAILNSSS